MEADPEPETHQRLTWRSKGYYCLLTFSATEGSRDRWLAQLCVFASAAALVPFLCRMRNTRLPTALSPEPHFTISSSRVQRCVSACLPLLGSGGEGDRGTGGQGSRNKRSSPSSAETVVIAHPEGWGRVPQASGAPGDSVLCNVLSRELEWGACVLVTHDAATSPSPSLSLGTSWEWAGVLGAYSHP